MRIVLLLLLVCSGVLRAQEQERKLEERLMHPDGALAFHPDKTTFLADKSFTLGGKAYVKDYNFEQKVQTKSFSSRNFYGAKDFWTGDFKLINSETVPRDRFVTLTASKTYDAGGVDVKNARESGKTVPIRNYAGNTAFKGRYDDQTELATNPKAKSKTAGSQQERDAELKPMTIDDVRALLNKNK